MKASRLKTAQMQSVTQSSPQGTSRAHHQRSEAAAIQDVVADSQGGMIEVGTCQTQAEISSARSPLHAVASGYKQGLNVVEHGMPHVRQREWPAWVGGCARKVEPHLNAASLSGDSVLGDGHICDKVCFLEEEICGHPEARHLTFCYLQQSCDIKGVHGGSPGTNMMPGSLGSRTVLPVITPLLALMIMPASSHAQLLAAGCALLSNCRFMHDLTEQHTSMPSEIPPWQSM